MPAHNWALDEYGELDNFAGSWGSDCRGPQCGDCHAVVCVVHADDEDKLADKLFANDCGSTP
jgi:hypothetical protein